MLLNVIWSKVAFLEGETKSFIFLKLICTLGCRKGWLSLFCDALLHHCSARLPCPPGCTQTAEAKAKTCTGPVDYGMLKGTATIKEDKPGFFQKKGQIIRAGIGKRTGCAISHAAFVMISTICELVLMGFKWQQNHKAPHISFKTHIEK